jgi:UDP-3-O-[3-hydroxymyristoyl] glucosamine N-acyltransferase
MTVQEIAEWLGAEHRGDGSTVINEVADLSAARADEVAFVAGSRAASQLSESNAGCVLVPPDLDTGDRTVIPVKDPRVTFVHIVRRFHPPKKPTPGIHPTAIVSPDAHLADEVTVGPYSTIGANSRIASGCIIGASCHLGDDVVLSEDGLLHDNVTIYHDVSIGSRVILHSGCVIGADGFGFVLAADHYEKFPQIGRVEIGSDVEIGANSTIDRAALGVTRIGDGVKLDNLVHVAHNCDIGNHVVAAMGAGLSGGCTIGNYVVIGGQAGFGEKVTVGDKAVLGGQSGILPKRTVAAGEVLWGTPARPIKEHLALLANLGKVAALRKQVAELEKRLERLDERVLKW